MTLSMRGEMHFGKPYCRMDRRLILHTALHGDAWLSTAWNCADQKVLFCGRSFGPKVLWYGFRTFFGLRSFFWIRAVETYRKKMSVSISQTKRIKLQRQTGKTTVDLQILMYKFEQKKKLFWYSIMWPGQTTGSDALSGSWISTRTPSLEKNTPKQILFSSRSYRCKAKIGNTNMAFQTGKSLGYFAIVNVTEFWKRLCLSKLLWIFLLWR